MLNPVLILLVELKVFLWGNKDKRSRYAHQVSLAALIKLAQDSYTTQNDGTQSLEDWLSEICEISVNARYWLTVIKLETLLFLFVLSIRDANFDLFLQSLEEIVIWMFSLDHFNYARWMAVFICDLKKLVAEKDDLYEKFKAGFFMVKKSKRRFSNIGFDHAHEQNNKIVKTDGGAIGILDSPAVLLKWAVAGPEISRILGTIDEENGEDDVIYNHHEDTDNFEKKFRNDAKKFYNTFCELGNPFQEYEDGLLNILNKYIVDSSENESVSFAYKRGKSQYEEFVTDRLCTRNKSIYSPIKSNKFLLFRQNSSAKTSKVKKRLK